MATAQPLVPRAVVAARIKALQARLERASYDLRDLAAKKATRPEPAEVKAARKLVQTFDDRNERAQNAARSKVRARVAAARNVVLFEDTGKALKLVEKLEAEARRA